jgi:diketogulonate reductase-like aldo/keto reductase
MPRLGLGTYRMTDRDACVEAVRTALDVGYGHVDTAQSYDNEAYVGEALAGHDAGDDVLLATKLSTYNLAYDDAVETARESRDRLGVDSIDLLYVHWPTRTYDPAETLPALDDLVDDGVVDRVGLSNFTPDLLDEARDRLDAPVFAHQVECHPLLPQDELRAYAVEHDHWLVAYCPIARNRVAEVDVLREVADANDTTPAAVSLAWLDSKENVVAIPKAASERHIRANYEALDVELTPDETARIDGIERRHRIVDSERMPW